jgi:cytohesin
VNRSSLGIHLFPSQIPCIAMVALFALIWGMPNLHGQNSFRNDPLTVPDNSPGIMPSGDPIIDGNLPKVEALLKDNPKLPFDKDSSGLTRLHWAAVYGHKAIAELLIAKGAEIDAKDNNNWTPLHWAAINCQKGVVELLLAKGADISSKVGAGYGGRTPLLMAAQNGFCYDVMELLLAKGAAINVKGDEGYTALHLVALFGPYNGRTPDMIAISQKGMKLLLAKGAEIDAKNDYGETPLHVAASETDGFKDFVELLLEKGAEIGAKNNKGETPLHRTNKMVAEVLLDRGAEINAKANDGTTPLHMAVGSIQKDLVEFLLDHGAEINAKAKDGTTPLHVIARMREGMGRGGSELINLTELLLAKGAEIDAKNTDGLTPLHLAEIKGYKGVVDFLRQHGGHE